MEEACLHRERTRRSLDLHRQYSLAMHESYPKHGTAHKTREGQLVETSMNGSTHAQMTISEGDNRWRGTYQVEEVMEISRQKIVYSIYALSEYEDICTTYYRITLLILIPQAYPQLRKLFWYLSFRAVHVSTTYLKDSLPLIMVSLIDAGESVRQAPDCDTLVMPGATSLVGETSSVLVRLRGLPGRLGTPLGFAWSRSTRTNHCASLASCWPRSAWLRIWIAER